MSPPPVLFKSLSFERAPAPRGSGAPSPSGGGVALRLCAGVIDLGLMVGLFVFAAAMAGSIDTRDGLLIHLDGGPTLLWTAVVLLHPLLMRVLTGRTPGSAALRSRP